MKFGTPQVGDLDVPLRGVRLLDGEVLVREGDEADDVYVISSGELVATTHSAYGDVIVGRIGEGHVVGEVTVIAGGRRTATLTASGPAEVQVIRRAEFEQWLEDHPDIADAVSAQARERIDRTQVAAMVSDLLGARDPVLVQDIVGTCPVAAARGRRGAVRAGREVRRRLLHRRWPPHGLGEAGWRRCDPGGG